MGCGQSYEEISREIQAAEERYRKDHAQQVLSELDAQTRVPHLLVEVRSLGFVELQGKNTGGIYEKLGAWLRNTWGAEVLDKDLQEKVSKDKLCCIGHYPVWEVGPVEDHNRLSDMSYRLGAMTSTGEIVGNRVYKSRGTMGENNMGKLTMQIVQFMTNECGWTFQVCDSGNLGFVGDIREQQMKFKAPHPLNIIAPHIMIELRQVGYIEVNGPNTQGIHEQLAQFFCERWPRVSPVEADPDYCDLKFTACAAFESRGTEGENNMGLRTMQLVDFMVKECQWTMVCCNGGNYGCQGTKREQQLVFRKDEFVQHGSDLFMVELRTCGHVEINGLRDAADLQPHLDRFLKETWCCTDVGSGTPFPSRSSVMSSMSRSFSVLDTLNSERSEEKYCEVKYACPPTFYRQKWEMGRGVTLQTNLGLRTLELAEFVGQHGWTLLLCNGGSIGSTREKVREQQVKFTRAKSSERAAAPLLMIELRIEPMSDSPLMWEGSVEICGKDTNGIYGRLDEFVRHRMDGEARDAAGFCHRRYVTRKFRMKPSKVLENWKVDGLMNGESNIGMWTMRLCDFMVDHLGEWDLLVCNSDNLGANFGEGCSVTAREMQLIFRHRPGGRRVFMPADDSKPLGRPPLQPPKYWAFPGCLSGEVAHHLASGTEEELSWMQELFDKTFKQQKTRDRWPGEELPDRLAVVQCLRSEHPELWDRFARRRQELAESCTARDVLGEFVEPRTMQCEGCMRRCVHAKLGNPSNQAYLLHGTNPTSAVAILERAFAMDLAGNSVGTMFGPGIYLTESSTKADEYAGDDVGGEYDGLYAMLVCRVALGRPLVVEDPGDYSGQVVYGDYDHVMGDREKAVGTFREFVLFHEASIYPEYAIFYRRELGGKILPPPKLEEAPALEHMWL